MMQLHLQHTETVQYFSESETNAPEYRRTSNGQWESRFGEAWEPMDETADLEAAFVRWQKHEHLDHLTHPSGASLPELAHALPL